MQFTDASDDHTITMLQGVTSVSRSKANEAIDQFAQALEEQSSAVREINENLMNLDGISRSNASASEEITTTVMELSKLADATRHQAECFRV